MFSRRVRTRRRLTGNDDEDDDGMSPFTQMMIPYVMEQVLRRAAAEQFLPRSHFPAPLRCPTCKFSHPYAPYNAAGLPIPPALQPSCQFSHHARVVFACQAQCPICLEDEHAQSLVNLVCGHVVCAGCFAQLGGRSGQEALKSFEQVRQEEYEKYRARLREERQQRGDDHPANPNNNIGNFGPPPPEEAMNMLMEMMQSVMGVDEDDLEDLEFGLEDFSDDDNEEVEEETDDEMPPLVDTSPTQPNDDTRENPQSDAQFDEMRVAMITTANNPLVFGQLRNNTAANGSNSATEADSDSTDDEMPPLEGRENTEDSSTDVEVPSPLRNRAIVQRHESSSSDESDVDVGPPPLRERTAGPRYENSSSSDSDDELSDLLPEEGPLLPEDEPRRGAYRDTAASESDPSTESDMPELNSRDGDEEASGVHTDDDVSELVNRMRNFPTIHRWPHDEEDESSSLEDLPPFDHTEGDESSLEDIEEVD